MAKSRQPTKSKQFWLYWVTTQEGAEDWFVVANNARAACRFFEEYEGFARGDASAERVLALAPKLLTGDGWKNGPRGEVSREAGWPRDALLVACGGEIAPLPKGVLQEFAGTVSKDVRIGGRLFRAGDIVETVQRQLLERDGRGGRLQ